MATVIFKCLTINDFLINIGQLCHTLIASPTVYFECSVWYAEICHDQLKTGLYHHQEPFTLTFMAFGNTISYVKGQMMHNDSYIYYQFNSITLFCVYRL